MASTVRVSYSKIMGCCLASLYGFSTKEFANMDLMQSWTKCVNCTERSEAGGKYYDIMWMSCINAYTEFHALLLKL